MCASDVPPCPQLCSALRHRHKLCLGGWGALPADTGRPPFKTIPGRRSLYSSRRDKIRTTDNHRRVLGIATTFGRHKLNSKINGRRWPTEMRKSLVYAPRETVDYSWRAFGASKPMQRKATCEKCSGISSPPPPGSPRALCEDRVKVYDVGRIDPQTLRKTWRARTSTPASPTPRPRGGWRRGAKQRKHGPGRRFPMEPKSKGRLLQRHRCAQPLRGQSSVGGSVPKWPSCQMTPDPSVGRDLAARRR